MFKQLSEHLSNHPSATILVYGPIGCGKTYGVSTLSAQMLGLDVFEINPSYDDTLTKMKETIFHVVKSKTLLGPRLLLIDDIDGFDPMYITAFASILKELKKEKKNVAPIIITCTDPYALCIAAFRDLPRFRMFSPSEDAMVSCVRTNMAISTVRHHVTECEGNFHQLFLRLKLFHNEKPDKHVSLFESTHDLLLGTIRIEDWVRSASSNVLTELLFQNYLNFSNNDDEKVFDWTEAFSTLDSMRGSDHSLHILAQHFSSAKIQKIPTLRMAAFQRTHSLRSTQAYDGFSILSQH